MSQSKEKRWPGSIWQQLLEIVGSAFALALILYAVVVALLRVEHGMSWDAGFRVVVLLPGGPAERAGIQLGDQLLTIGGYPVDAWHLPITRWHPGQDLRVTVERGGERFVYTVGLTPLSWPERLGALGSLIIALGFWVTSALMPGLGRQTAEVRLFRAFSQVGSATLAAGNLSGVGLVWAGHLFGVLGGLLVPLLLHFHISLPGARLERRRHLVLLTAYAVGAVVAAIFLLPGSVGQWWRAGWGSRGLRIALGTALLASVIWLIFNYVITRSLDVRRRLRLVVLGTVWGIVPLFFLSLLPDLLRLDFVPYQFTMPFLVLIPFTYWIAVVRLDLLRVDLALNRSLVYLSITAILVGSYVLALRLVGLLLPSLAFSRDLIGILILAGVGMVAIPLQGLIQRVVDRAFFGGWYDYRSVVSDVSRSLTGTLDRHILEKLLLERAAGTLWVRGAALLLPDPRLAGRLVGRQHGSPLVEPSHLVLGVYSSLARHLCAAHRPLETTALRKRVEQASSSLADDPLVSEEAIRWWVPMVSGNRLVGLLLLGARVGSEQFDADDLVILSTLADQAALAITNILLVEELRSQLEEIERSHRILEQMHQQVLMGREDEQKRLARDLHDGPVQQLIAFRYQLRECLASSEQPCVRDTLSQLREETGRLLDDLRGLCSNLRPPLLDAFGLATAIRSHSEEVGRRLGLEIVTTLNQECDEHLPEEVAVSLFRIYQEALANAVRHANAGQVAIRLYQEKSLLTLEVDDDGDGFLVPDPIDLLAAQGHFGLLGIRERIELLAGTFELASQPGSGTQLRVQIHAPAGS